jgi:hypothetical protein
MFAADKYLSISKPPVIKVPTLIQELSSTAKIFSHQVHKPVLNVKINRLRLGRFNGSNKNMANGLAEIIK